MTMDLDKLDAMIAAAPAPMIVIPREQLAALSRDARAGNAARAMLAGQGRIDTAIAGIAGGHRAGIAPQTGA